MILSSCTITGLDNETHDFEQVTRLSNKYPFVEWAILHSPANAGEPRFPTAEWIGNFRAALPDLHASLHLCREGLMDFLSGNGKTDNILKLFDRVQLNVGFGVDRAAIDPAQLWQRVSQHPQTTFILQYSERTQHLHPSVHDVPNMQILFDASAGAGLSPGQWPKPIAGRVCGYAGGIGPENVSAVLDTLRSIVPANERTWIDMETRVRTNNRFDYAKVESVLEQVALAAQKPALKSQHQLVLGLS